MKKLYSALILCCLNVVAFAQTMTGIVNAVGTPGSFKTGYAEKGSPSIRVDGDLQVHYALTSPVGDRRGWAVFNLNNVVPAGANVQSVNLRFTISSVTDVNPSTVGIYGYVGDLSTVTDPDLVFAGCNGNGIYTGSNFNGSSWGASAATLTLPFNAAGVGFINTNAPGFVTIGWQSSSNSLQTYTITGENGTLATQPQLEIVYTCNGVSSVTAAASPGTLCDGTTLSLTSTGTGVTSWEWTGPNVYSSTLANPTLPVVMASAGVYTLTASNGAGCGTKAYTFPVTVNPLPAAITGPTTVCVASTIGLANPSGPGTWTSSNTSVATVGLNTGVVSGVAPGIATISFTLASTGCIITRPVLSLATPTVIAGPHRVCENGGFVALSQAVTGGTWSSSNTTVATVTNGGVVTPVGPGTTTITYSNGCSSGASHSFTVNPVPAAISGGNWVCSGGTLNLTQTSTGGTWSSQYTSIATVSSTGQVHGVATGTVNISYTFPTGCYAVKSIMVNPTPPPIAGATICAYDSVTLTASGYPGVWSSLNTTIAVVVDTVLGKVKAKAPGVVAIRFKTSCNVIVTTSVTVLPIPAPIAGIRSVCNGLTTYLTDITAGGTWSSLNTNIATVPYSDSGRIYGNTVGITRITYGMPNGCVSTVSFTVTGPPPPAPIDGVGTVCVGQTIQLSQVTGVGWWTTSNSALATVNLTSGVVTGTGMGFVNITYSIGSMNNCTAWKTIQIHPLDPITGVDSICNGTTTYLADIVGSGIWSSSVSTVATIHPASGFVQSVAPGVTRITYVTPQGCITTKSLTVIAIPPPITGAIQTCPGQNILLSNANPGGRWTTTNTGVATAQASSGRIYGVAPDTVTVVYTVRPGCSTNTVITVNPNPAPITGSNGICATTRDTVFDATPGGTWSISPLTLATIDTDGVIQSLAAGTVNITYTLPVTGCRSILTVPVRPLPVSSITFVDSVNTLYADTGYQSYQWYGTLEGIIVGANSRSIAGLETQGYYVVVSDTFGCVGTSAIFPYNVHMGFNDPTGADVRIFPNPATSVIRIESSQPLRAVITTIDGKAVLEKENAHEVNISSLANGMYFVVLYNDHNQAIATRKLVKRE